jgi:hypothetical protein
MKLVYLECEKNQALFEWVNMETGGLLVWAFLTDNLRELKYVTMENSLVMMREISKKKGALREVTSQLKEVVEVK